MLAVFLMAGIAMGNILPAIIWLAIGAAVAACAASTALLRNGTWSSLLLAGAVLASGIAAGQLNRLAYPASAIANFSTDQPRLAKLRLRITDPPRTIEGQWHESKQIAHATLLAAQCTDGWQPATGDITVHLSNSINTLHIGDKIESLGWLSRPPFPDNPGEFDWLSYYRRQRVVASFQITDSACIKLLDNQSPNPIWRLRQSTHDLLLRGFGGKQSVNAAVLDALLLGDRTSAERDIQDLFVQTGTPHLVVISGFHVFIVAAFIYLICRLMRIRPRISAITVMTCVLLYGLIVLPSLPAARAVLFCELTFLGIIFRRSIDLLQILGICACIILIASPMDLTDAGFQLTFVSIFILIVYGRRFMEWMSHFRSGAIGTDTRDLQQGENPVSFWLRSAFFSAIIGWLAILPLILFYFNRLNPWAIFGGVALTPFVFLAVIVGLLKILLTLVFPFAAASWATLAAFPITLLIKSVGWLALLPGSDVLQPAPPVWTILIYYALLLLPLIRWNISWRWPRLSPLAGCALLLFPWPLAGAHYSQSPLRLTVLGVGAGTCCVLETPDGHIAVIDAGSSTISDLERTVIKPFMRQRQIRRIDDLFISHPDSDHYNAVQQTIDDFPTHEVLIDSAFSADARGNYGATRLLNWLNQSHRVPRLISAGEQIPLGRDVYLDTLWPPANSRFNHNDDSLVLRIRYAGRSILIPGDIESLAERQLINSRPDLPSDILIAPHHGSSVDMTPYFIEKVNPQFIISSNDNTPTSKQIHFEHEIAKRNLYRTDRSGAITVMIDAQGAIAVTSFQLKR